MIRKCADLIERGKFFSLTDCRLLSVVRTLKNHLTLVLCWGFGTAIGQVVTLQCAGTAHFPQVSIGSAVPPGTSMSYSGTVNIDPGKGVFSGDLFSATAIAGFPIWEVEITEFKPNQLLGKKTFTTRNGATHALNVSIDRNTGKLAFYEFPLDGRASFTGFLLTADCKVARPLF